jgi:hypothetical protein
MAQGVSVRVATQDRAAPRQGNPLKFIIFLD